MKKTHLIIFAKAPLLGFAKTRLIPELGESGAEQVARGLLSLSVANAALADVSSIELCVAPNVDHPVWRTLGLPQSGKHCEITFSQQVDGDLGARLADGMSRALLRGESVIVTGTDCPGLTPERINQAVIELEKHDSVIYPVSDGGYALMGLNSDRLPADIDTLLAGLLGDIHWSTSVVFQETMAAMRNLELNCWQGEELHDIDEAEDLCHLPKSLMVK